MDGSNPGALIQAANGDLYGTTETGGANDQGSAFKITPTGTLTALYSFCSQSACTDGAGPGGLVQASDGNFYGTTGVGGVTNASCPSGCGTVFRIDSTGALETLYSFCPEISCTDGAVPYALIQATNGDLYGTTGLGGNLAHNCNGSPASGCGTVFKISPTGVLTTLYSFCSQGGDVCTDGETPEGALTQATNGKLYGTAYTGGINNAGTIFEITPSAVRVNVFETLQSII